MRGGEEQGILGETVDGILTFLDIELLGDDEVFIFHVSLISFASNGRLFACYFWIFTFGFLFFSTYRNTILCIQLHETSRPYWEFTIFIKHQP